MARKKLRNEIEKQILFESARRCCLCYGLHNDLGIKQGQIAHIDKDSSNDSPTNLVFLCLFHHDQYDSVTSQSKNITKSEVLAYKKLLLEYNSNNRQKVQSITESIVTNPNTINVNKKKQLIDFIELIKTTASIISITERDEQYLRLVSIALKYDEPGYASEITSRIINLTKRDQHYEKIIKFYLESNRLSEARMILKNIINMSLRDQLTKEILEFHLREL